MLGRWLLVSLMVARTLSDSCLAPSLENGEVEGRGTDNGWTGSFSCNPGFILVGSSRLKCMMGGSVARWSSASFPVCAAMGKCDPSRLPSVENGELVSYRPRKFRSSVYKYHCAVGYTIFGPSLVHCSAGGTWDLRHPPVCAKPGCDESLVSSITLGQAKRKAHGGVYVFRCSAGSQLEGPSTLVCDGHNWNSTTPTCLIGPEKVSIGGADTLLQGQASGFSCVSSPSNPPAEIQWGAKDVHGDAVDHLLQEGESSSSWAGSGWETTSTVMLHPESGLTSLTLTCSATNPTLGHTATSHKRVLIQFAPEGVTVSGSARVRAGQEVHLTCKSTRSVPASSLHWTVTQGDQTVQHTPGDQVKQLEDGSFTTHSHLTLKALPAADLVAECFATSPVLGADSVAYAHVVEIISPPGVPTISGVVPSAQVQHLNCSTSAGKPPASLSWFRGSEMMASHYSVEGDTVSAIITFVPSHTDQVVLSCLLVAATAAPLTDNELQTRLVAITKAKPELLSAALASADPQLLREALTHADPQLLEIALTRSRPALLRTALSPGVRAGLLRSALTEARPDTLRAALTQADPELLAAALSEASEELLAIALTKADTGLLGVALTKGVKRELLVTALTRSTSDNLAAALTVANPELLRVALTESRPDLLATALQEGETAILGVALTLSLPKLLAIALQDATPENLKVALTSA